jgi:hypothetical protein
MRRLITPLLAASISIALVSCGSGDEGDPGEAGYQPIPAPGTLGEVEKNFASIMSGWSRAQATRTPWAGYWWPYTDNGIAGPASKYDSAIGGGGAASWERSHHGSSVPNLQDWFGHCNGWAAAAVLTTEPRSPKAVRNIQFGVGDQKALLSELGMEVDGDFFGTRQNGANDNSSLSFQDVFPNQFFLVLTNYIGRGFPLIIDRYTGNQVWNHPVAAYEISPVTRDDYLGADPSAPNVHRVLVSMKIWWVRDDVNGSHLTEPFAFNDGPSYESRVLRGEIWLDGAPEFDSTGALRRSGDVILPRQGNFVLGGAWRNGGLPASNSHPDYIWRPTRFKKSTGFSNPELDANWIGAHLGAA